MKNKNLGYLIAVAIVIMAVFYKHKPKDDCGAGCTDCADCRAHMGDTVDANMLRAEQFPISSAETHSYIEGQRLAAAQAADPLELMTLFYRPVLSLASEHFGQTVMPFDLPDSMTFGAYNPTAEWSEKVNA